MKYSKRAQSSTPEALESRIAPATFTVTSGTDGGTGSLRQALLDAAASPGADDIIFDLGTSPVVGITSPLPLIDHVVNINGTDAATGRPGVQIFNGADVVNGFVFAPGSSGSSVSGISIGKFSRAGINIQAGDGIRIENNYVGLALDGFTTTPNGNGVLITGGIGALVKGNVVSGNNDAGVAIYGTATSRNTVVKNLIGFDSSGLYVKGNGCGIEIGDSKNNIVGGSDGYNTANIIGGSKYYGILITGPDATGNCVNGNDIGVDITGRNGVGNGRANVAVLFGASGNFIGKATPGGGNVISGNTTGPGLLIEDSNNNVAQCNFIGTDPSGCFPIPNSVGVKIVNGEGNVIGGNRDLNHYNLISSNIEEGVKIIGGGGNKVLGNQIGTKIGGCEAMPNRDGVTIENSSGNFIGDGAEGSTNLISGNQWWGITVLGAGSVGNKIYGNDIGVNCDCTSALGNGSGGVLVRDGARLTEIGANINNLYGNVISGHTNGPGVSVQNAIDTKILCNVIGADCTGTIAIPNEKGIVVGGSTGTRIGDFISARNVISGNTGPAIDVNNTSSDTKIAGNFIGVNLPGTAPLPNGGEGVRLNGSSNTVVGGTDPGQGNWIRHNGGGGVWVLENTAQQNSIIGNSISGNKYLGIDLAGDHITANDLGDADSGPNGFINKPVLGSVTTTAGQTTISGTYNGPANQTIRIELFANDALEADGTAEGLRYLGFVNVTTDASGNATYSHAVADVGAGKFITATATTAVQSATSEFSTPLVNTTGTGGGGTGGGTPAQELIAVGAGHGEKPMVKVFAKDGSLVREFLAFEANNKCGVRVATGDLNGDGIDDIVAATGGKRGEVKVFSGADGSVLWSQLPFGKASVYNKGIYVAVGDTDGDGKNEVIAGAGAGAGPCIKVLNGQTGATNFKFNAFSSSFRGGVAVAAGDLNGDGKDEIVASAGGGSSKISVFSGTGQFQKTFRAFAGEFVGNTSVAVGDINGDGNEDIIVGSGSGKTPTVRAFNAASLTVITSIDVFPSNYKGGVRVATGFVNADGIADIIIAGSRSTTATPLAPIAILDGLSTTKLRDLPSFTVPLAGGVFVG
jgi:hypothetical protein